MDSAVFWSAPTVCSNGSSLPFFIGVQLAVVSTPVLLPSTEQVNLPLPQEATRQPHFTVSSSGRVPLCRLKSKSREEALSFGSFLAKSKPYWFGVHTVRRLIFRPKIAGRW